MKTTSIKKSSPAKKAPAAKKTVAAKASSPAKKTTRPKASTKVSTPTKKIVSAKVETSAVKIAPTKKKAAPVSKNENGSVSSSVSKTAATKKTVKRKTTSVTKKISVEHIVSASSKDGVKMIGVLHLIGYIISGGLLSSLFVIIYFFIKKDSISSLEKNTCFEVINFNLSFLLYSLIAGLLFGIGIPLMFVLVGFLLVPILPIVVVMWFVLMVIGFLSHLNGENYQYPFIIRFIK